MKRASQYKGTFTHISLEEVGNGHNDCTPFVASDSNFGIKLLKNWGIATKGQ